MILLSISAINIILIKKLSQLNNLLTKLTGITCQIKAYQKLGIYYKKLLIL
jgi:hypothetical protein